MHGNADAVMLINSLVSPLSCDLKLINRKSLNKGKNKNPPTNNGLRAISFAVRRRSRFRDLKDRLMCCSLVESSICYRETAFRERLKGQKMVFEKILACIGAYATKEALNISSG